jgi:hypothetical protein
MSVKLKLSSIHIDIRKKILQDLTVHAKETKYGKNVPIYLFDVDVDNDILYCPLAYYFHYLEENKNIQIIKEKKRKIKNQSPFNGTLTEGQNGVKSQVFELLNFSSSILFSAYCGFGKTAFSIFISSLKSLPYEVFILCHRVTIYEQWRDSIIKFCGENVGVQILTAKNKKIEGCKFYIMNISNVHKRDRRDYSNCGILVCDEAHCMCSDISAQQLLYFSPKILFALTATPEKSNDLDIILEHFFGPFIIRQRMKRPFNVYVRKYKGKIKTKTTNNGLDWGDVLEQQCGDAKRNDMIIEIITKFWFRNIFVLCKRKTQSKYIFDRLKEMGEDVDIYISTQKKYNYNCRVLVSTFSKSGVGFNNTRLDMLIFASDVQEGLEQYLGRVIFRSSISPIVIDFQDSFYQLYKHSLARLDFMKTMGGDVREFDFF